MEKLKDTFARIIFYLEEKGMAKVPYHLAIPEAAQHVKKEVAQLKGAPACIPPCGFQREARWFRCTTCSIVDCQLPIDCPLQDVNKFEGDATLLSCKVKFQIPPDCTFRWKFAKDMRTDELFFFQDLSFGFEPSLLIRPTLGSHHGTIACQIEEGNDVLIRKFFYLNVSEKRLGLEKKLQEMFKAILNSPPEVGLEEVVESRPPSLKEMLSGPDALSKKSVIFLIVGIALSSMVLTLGAMRHTKGSRMKEEVETAVRFITRVVNRYEKMASWQLEHFSECLTAVLCERFTDHWYPENPVKGQAYRCIRINQKHRVDDSILKACQECGLDYSSLFFPWEISIWIDPGEVSCRLGENNRFFKVKDEESSSGKASPELVTSDYHSESPSECSSEDEGMARGPATTWALNNNQPERKDAKQATHYYYTPSPLWVPCPQTVVGYIPTYQPLAVYYLPQAAVSKPPVARNPNLVKRLTKRASKN